MARERYGRFLEPIGQLVNKRSVQSREWDLDPRPADYESAALPLSYLG
jgi:hypothetical protein